MSQQEQILELNSTVKCRLGPSKIHGVGVFTLRDIYKDEKLYLLPNEKPHWYHIPPGSMSKLFPEVKELILSQWASIINGSRFLSPNDSCWMGLYINHDDNPNYQADVDKSLRDIKKGEEITENYRLMNNWQTAFPWLT